MVLAKAIKIMLRNTAASHGSFMFVGNGSLDSYTFNPCSYGEQSIDLYTCSYSGNVPDGLCSFILRAARGNSKNDDSSLFYSSYASPNLDIYLFTSGTHAYRGKITSVDIYTHDYLSVETIHCEFCLYHDKNPMLPRSINTGSTTHRVVPGIERIIFNDPATIVYWTDGTKTVVKAHDEEFSEEHGLAMAMARKFLECRGCEFPRASFKRLVKEATR